MQKVIVTIFIFTILLISNTILAQKNDSAILVQIDNIPSDEGQMIISLHNKKNNFPKSPIKKVLAKITNGKSEFVFSNLKKGYYAITAIHDENKNGKLDFNLLHIPKEDVCASNNATGFLGPPSFLDAKFEVSDTFIVHQIQFSKK